MGMSEWLDSRKAADGPSGAPVRPAATVVLLRDGDDAVDQAERERQHPVDAEAEAADRARRPDEGAGREGSLLTPPQEPC